MLTVPSLKIRRVMIRLALVLGLAVAPSANAVIPSITNCTKALTCSIQDAGNRVGGRIDSLNQTIRIDADRALRLIEQYGPSIVPIGEFFATMNKVIHSRTTHVIGGGLLLLVGINSACALVERGVQCYRFVRGCWNASTPTSLDTQPLIGHLERVTSGRTLRSAPVDADEGDDDSERDPNLLEAERLLQDASTGAVLVFSYWKNRFSVRSGSAE